jgi:hypothetical protein
MKKIRPPEKKRKELEALLERDAEQLDRSLRFRWQGRVS